MTSFKKKTTSRGRPPLLKGVKPSLSNNQLLVSCGCPSLDTLLGGGLAVGTVMLIEEDPHQSYTNILHKLFLGEGVVCDQSLFLASSDGSAEEVLKQLPKSTNDEDNKEPSKATGNDPEDLKIAWRYQNVPKVQSSVQQSQFGHYFDLSETISEERVKSLNATCFSPSRVALNASFNGIKVAYKNLLESITQTITKNNLYTANSTSIPSILRISVSSLGSPRWNESLISSDVYDPSLAWFLLSLRSLLRKSYAVCVVSVPTYLFEEKHFVKRVEHCADVVVHIDSFAGSDKSQNPLFKEYHGLFDVKKVSHLNAICGHNIDTSDLAFKVQKRKFLIEKLHLPPDISETVNRSTAVKPGAPLCSATKPTNNLLDF